MQNSMENMHTDVRVKRVTYYARITQNDDNQSRSFCIFFYSDDQGSPSLCKKADFYIGIWNLDFGVRANFANNFTL